jgi:hypothetical protein
VGKALLVVILFALVVYGVLRLLERRRAGLTGRGPVRPAPPRRPLAPDDDPNFLRDLEQRRRREQHEREQRKPDRPAPPPRSPEKPEAPGQSGKKQDQPRRDDESEAS